MCLRASLLCLALAICAAPAGAYFAQGESVPGLLGISWTNKTPASLVSVTTVNDALASRGKALSIVDTSTSGGDDGSASESSIGAVDGLSVAASSSNGTGTVIIDWVAYRAGEDPYWNPVP